MGYRRILSGLQLIFLFCNNIFGSYSQADTLRKSIVKIETAVGGIQIEHRFSKKSSFQMSVLYSFKGILNSDVKDFQIIPEYRYYIFKKEWPAGFFVGSYAFFKNYVVARDMDSYGSMVYSKDLVKTSGIGLKAGYQWLFKNQFSLDMSLGLGYNIYCDVLHKQGIIIIEENSHFLNFSGMISCGYLF